ncbi:LptM family lipoprotein [Succinatimonas hippei]|uniref:Lipoprotein n=1 Tax=Succinatimonas hippei (strain DSM 22608 / JCM 16073 / KCTC 15190 / YIT 12066) TaxID=762983 RepID=E8LIJ0_SUCHY|nr:lipoprotein [Succinatimonas hippei]EFY07678.1 hypothetical protein HMPREF9444_00508 [Succinatimonas hippei YIT 12066]MDM8120747.1 lipoprotein [Succinatimonas hippei]
MKFSAVLSLFILCAVSGCGLKYDLYLPEPETVQTVDAKGNSAEQGQLTLFDSSAAAEDNTGSQTSEEITTEE